MVKKNNVKGISVSTKLYKIAKNSTVTVPKLTGLKPDDLVAIEKMDNGNVILIPKRGKK
ncbi:MAG: hypothetical protein WC389_03565 [Lutibacter sp.]|jgi:hypothetical protein